CRSEPQMAAAVFLMRMPPASTSGVGSVSSSSGLPGCNSTAVSPLGTGNPPWIERSESVPVPRQPQPVPPDHLVVGQAALQVLGDHVDVLEMPLQQVALVDRGGAGRAVTGGSGPCA